MATVVETLVVGIKYQVDRQSLKLASRSFQRSAASLSQSASDLAGLASGPMATIGRGLENTAVVLSGVATAAVGAGLALGALGISQAVSQDALAKMAAALNTSTEELSALEFAADRSGISSSQLTTTLERLNRSATKAAQEGTSASGKAFKDLGISARDAAGDLKSPAELLPEIAQGLLGVKDTGRASEIQIELLGRSALRMGALLGQGSRGIKDLTDQARDFGAVISSEAAANSEAFIDSLTNLKSTSGALVRQLGDSVIPHLTSAAQATADWLSTSDNFVRVGMQRTIAGLTVVLSGLRSPLGQVTAGMVGLAAAAPLVNKAFTRLGATIGIAALPAVALATAIAFTVLAIDDLVVTVQGGDSVIRRMADSLGIGEEAVTILSSSAKIATDSIALGFTLVGEAVQFVIQPFTDAASLVGDLADQAAVAFPALQGVADAINAIGDGIGSLAKLGIGNLAGLLEGIADITGRARKGDIAPELTAALGAQESGVGSAIATLLESSAQRSETGRGFGVGEAVRRRSQIEDIGTAALVERGDLGGALRSRGSSDFGQVQEIFGPRFETELAQATLGSLSTVLAAVLNPGGESRANLAGGASANVNLVVNAGTSLIEMADAAAEATRRAILSQDSAITDAI